MKVFIVIGKKDLEYILDDLESRITKLPETGPMGFDKWLVASSLQKSIRRGETQIAMNCAARLWEQDKRMLWRRLGVIALEDLGIGDVGGRGRSVSSVFMLQLASQNG